MKKLRSVVGKSKNKTIRIRCSDTGAGVLYESDGRLIDPQELLISKLLSIAVKEFFKELESDVQHLCGGRYTHGT